jgi:hypothetical protein
MEDALLWSYYIILLYQHASLARVKLLIALVLCSPAFVRRTRWKTHAEYTVEEESRIRNRHAASKQSAASTLSMRA